MLQRPLYDNVVIKVTEPDKVSESGLIIPTDSLETVSRGTIMMVGDGILMKERGDIIPLTVKVGDEVIFDKKAGTKIKIDGVDVILMRENQIIGIVDNG